MVIFADFKGQMQRKSKILQEYCDAKGLMVNVSKTKILIFHHKHVSQLSNRKFIYNNLEVEIVRQFTNLGVTFCTCGKFHEQAQQAIQKASAASVAIISIILRSRTFCWSSMMKLKE